MKHTFNSPSLIVRPARWQVLAWLAGMCTLTTLALAGCENPAPAQTTQDHVAAQPATPTEPVEVPQPPPPSDPCKLLGDLIRETQVAHPVATPGNYSQRADVKAYAHRVATCYNLDEAWVLQTLGKAKYQTSTVKFIMPQPAGERNWQKFKARFLQSTRIQGGVRFWRAHVKWLNLAEKTYGVPPEIVLAILGVETSYGQVTGNFRIVDALATLSFDFPKERSDRTDYFSGELAQYLAFAARQHIDPLSIKGSYAGAMGMPQFMPSSLLQYGVDFDGDGHIDLHSSVPDIIGSVAHYLSAHGWQAGLPSTFAVTLNNTSSENLDLLRQPDITPTFTAQTMATHGVVVEMGALASTLSQEKLSFILLENGADGVPEYVAGTKNFFVITRYNRSSFYAMTVVDLGHAIATAYKATAVQPPSKRAGP